MPTARSALEHPTDLRRRHACIKRVKRDDVRPERVERLPVHRKVPLVSRSDPPRVDLLLRIRRLHELDRPEPAPRHEARLLTLVEREGDDKVVQLGRTEVVREPPLGHALGYREARTENRRCVRPRRYGIHAQRARRQLQFGNGDGDGRRSGGYHGADGNGDVDHPVCRLISEGDRCLASFGDRERRFLEENAAGGCEEGMRCGSGNFG